MRMQVNVWNTFGTENLIEKKEALKTLKTETKMSSALAKCGHFHASGTTTPRATAGLPSEWPGWNQRHKVRQLKAEKAASCSRDCDPDMYHTPEKRMESHFLPLLILSASAMHS